MSRIRPVLDVVDVHFLSESIVEGRKHGGYDFEPSYSDAVYSDWRGELGESGLFAADQKT